MGNFYNPESSESIMFDKLSGAAVIFEYNPKQKKTSITDLTAKKKAITVSWKKQSKGIKGYEIQYSTNKKFEENVKTVKIGKAKTTKKTIKKLKSGKKYYLRIRTYKENDGGIVYSNWSKKKSVKVK